MKQGTGTNYSDRKVEPKPQAINPGGVSQLGTAVAGQPTPIHAGRGFQAPKPNAETSHPCGSQGKH